jgi:hypothetical protein
LYDIKIARTGFADAWRYAIIFQDSAVDYIKLSNIGWVGDGVTDNAAKMANLNAALTASVRGIDMGSGTFACSGLISIQDKDVSIRGAGGSNSKFLFTSAGAGIKLVDTVNTEATAKRFSLSDFSITHSVNLTRAIHLEWGMVPYSFHPMYTIESVDVRSTNIQTGIAATNALYIKNGTQGHITNFTGSNQRDVLSGSAITFDGFCLASTIVNPRLNYYNKVFDVLNLPVQIIVYTSPSGTIAPGQTVTSPTGSGIILFKYPSTQISVHVISGTFSNGQVITTATGSGTINGAPSARTWGGEGFQIFGGELVGVNYGVYCNQVNTAKRVTLIKSEGMHVNPYIAAYYLDGVDQIAITGAPSLFVSAANAKGVYADNFNQMVVSGNNFIFAGTSNTGTYGVHVPLNTAPPENGNIITITSNNYVSLDNPISISGGNTNGIVALNQVSACTNDISVGASVYPSGNLVDGTGIWVGLNRNDAIGSLGTKMSLGPRAFIHDNNNNIVRLGLLNASRSWALSNYGTDGIGSPAGAFTISDETSGQVRFQITPTAEIYLNPTNNKIKINAIRVPGAVAGTITNLPTGASITPTGYLVVQDNAGTNYAIPGFTIP